MREAQRLLETTTLSVEVVAEAVGYGSAVGLRERFAAILGVSPLAYRRAFSSKANFPQAQTIAPGRSDAVRDCPTTLSWSNFYV